MITQLITGIFRKVKDIIRVCAAKMILLRAVREVFIITNDHIKRQLGILKPK